MIDYRGIDILSKCISSNSNAISQKQYDFSLEMVLYQFLLAAHIDDPYAGLSGLKMLLNEYTSINNISFTLEELLENQWIRLEFGEWSPAIGYVKLERLSEIHDPKLRETLAFLNFLRERQYTCRSVAIISEPEEIIEKCSSLYPCVRDLEWYIKKRILVKNGNEYGLQVDTWEFSFEMNKSAAMVWYSLVENDEHLKFFMGLIDICMLTSRVLEYMCSEQRVRMLKWCIDVLEHEEFLGDINRERMYVNRLEMSNHFDQLVNMTFDQFNKIDILPDDLYKRFRYIERDYFRVYSTLFGRNHCRLHFFVSSLTVWFSEIPNDLQKRAAIILFNLHGICYFARHDAFLFIKAESLLSLSQCEQTQFLCVYLLLTYVRTDSIDVRYAIPAFEVLIDSILSGSIMVGSKCRTNPEQVSLIIQYLVSNCSFYEQESERLTNLPEKRTELQNHVLLMFINRIKANLDRTKDILHKTVLDLNSLLDSNDQLQRSLVLGSLITIAKQIYSGDTAFEKDTTYEQILKCLDKYYYSVFEGEPHKSELYLHPSYWSLPIWYDVYLSADTDGREHYHTPFKLSLNSELSETEEISIKYSAARRAIIQTCIIFEVAKNANLYVHSNADLCNIVHNAFYECLVCYQFNEQFNIFKVDWIMNYGVREILDNIGAYVDPKHNGWVKFHNALRNAQVEQLVLWLDATTGYAAEGTIRSLLHFAIEQGRLPSEHIINIEAVTNLVNKHRLEKLYDWGINELLALLDNLNKYNNPNVSDKKQLISNLVYSLYYLQGSYEKIKNSDNLFFKGVLMLDEGKNEDACKIFERLAKDNPSAAVYLNWMYGYILLMQDDIHTDRNALMLHFAQSSRVVEQANAVCNGWSEDERIHYASHLILRNELMYGKSKLYVQEIFARFRIRPEQYKPEVYRGTLGDNREKNVATILDVNEDTVKTTPFFAMPSSKKLVEYLRYMEIHDANYEETFEIMFVKFILETIQSIHNYSTQLYSKDIQLKQIEDRYTELFREIFNRAYGELWGINCSDQSRSGPTGKEVGRGGVSENDLTFFFNGNKATIGEALCCNKLKETEKNNVIDHIEKLIAVGNNFSPMFMMIYYFGDNPRQFCDEYMHYINEELLYDECHQISVRFLETNSFKDTRLYRAEMFHLIQSPYVYCSKLLYPNGNSATLYHIISDFRNELDNKLAFESRKQ